MIRSVSNQTANTNSQTKPIAPTINPHSVYKENKHILVICLGFFCLYTLSLGYRYSSKILQPLIDYLIEALKQSIEKLPNHVSKHLVIVPKAMTELYTKEKQHSRI